MRKTFDEVEEFLKNNKLDESDDGGFWFYSQDEKTYLLIIFDWDKMYDSIYYVYEPEKITVDPYFSNPASEEFDYTFDKTMVKEIRWVDETLENEIKLELTEEQKDKIIDYIYKYHNEVKEELDRDLYRSYTNQ